MKYPRELIEGLEKTLPPFFLRSKAKEATAGLITGGYLAFLACRGGGPRFTKVGNKVVYTRSDFIDWLKERKTYDDRYDFESSTFGRRASRPQGADFGFERAVEEPEGEGGRVEDFHPLPDGGLQVDEP